MLNDKENEKIVSNQKLNFYNPTIGSFKNYTIWGIVKLKGENQ